MNCARRICPRAKQRLRHPRWLRRRAGQGEPVGARAASDEIESMYAHLESALVALEFLDPANPKKLMSRLRRLFARSGLEREEVNIVRGIAKHILLKTRPPGGDAS